MDTALCAPQLVASHQIQLIFPSSFRRGSTPSNIHDAVHAAPTSRAQQHPSPVDGGIPVSGRCPIWPADPGLQDPGCRAVYRDCTTRQSNTHGSELRKLVYPWHPWAGRDIWICATQIRNDRTIFHCVVDPNSDVPAIEVPQWMFDRAACCRMQSAPSPSVNVEALRELKNSLTAALRGVGQGVVEAQHCSLSVEGGADARRSEVTTGDTTQTISASDAKPPMAAIAARNPATDGAFAGAAPLRACGQRGKAGRRRGR